MSAVEWSLSEDKLPSLAMVIADVRLMIGSGVIERQKLMQKLLITPVG